MRRRLSIGHVLLATLVLLTVVAASVYAEPVTIRFNYRGGSEARTRVVQEWIAEFERLHPDIKVEWEIPTSDWQQKIIVGMATGTAPDVTEFWGNLAQELARPGLLLDLRPYVERDFTEEDIADIYPPHWDNSTVHVGPNKGAQFALPLYTNTTVMYFNETYFREAGLQTPLELDRRGEWTWEALQASAQKLTQTVDGQVTRWGFNSNWTNWFRVVQFLWEAGGDWFAPDNPTEFIGHEPEAVAAGEFIQDMIWTHRIAPPTWDANAFSKGTVAIVDDGLNEIFARYDAAIKDAFEWNVAPRPKGPVGRKPVTFDDGLGIWAGTQHPEAAWEFVKFIASKQGQEIMTKHQGLAPVRRSALPAYLELDHTRNLGVVLDHMMEAQMVITSRTAGDIRKISDTIGYEILVPAFRTNAKPYSVLAQEVKPKVDAILQEGYN